MNGKYLGVVIGAVVAIMLVGGLLMPIIDNASPQKETVPAEGAYGPDIMYSDTPTVNLSRSILIVAYEERWDRLTITVDGLGTVYNGARSEFPNKIILYADSNATVYLDGNYLHISNYNDGAAVLLDSSGLSVKSRSTGEYRYGPSSGYVTADAPTYCYIVYDNGDYANFEGDNPPSMDTPTVSVAGMYIGPRMTIGEKPGATAPIYLAIPVVLLASLLVAVAFVAFRRQY